MWRANNQLIKGTAGVSSHYLVHSHSDQLKTNHAGGFQDGICKILDLKYQQHPALEG